MASHSTSREATQKRNKRRFLRRKEDVSAAKRLTSEHLSSTSQAVGHLGHSNTHEVQQSYPTIHNLPELHTQGLVNHQAFIRQDEANVDSSQPLLLMLYPTGHPVVLDPSIRVTGAPWIQTRNASAKNVTPLVRPESSAQSAPTTNKNYVNWLVNETPSFTGLNTVSTGAVKPHEANFVPPEAVFTSVAASTPLSTSSTVAASTTEATSSIVTSPTPESPSFSLETSTPEEIFEFIATLSPEEITAIIETLSPEASSPSDVALTPEDSLTSLAALSPDGSEMSTGSYSPTSSIKSDIRLTSFNGATQEDWYLDPYEDIRLFDFSALLEV
ncbi:threonine-rich gpi-anchored glycoprotein [Biomphalaria glabrata]|nr:threonine-rich gpi-anchored glycoprotein [Biomphalaria glabrata]